MPHIKATMRSNDNGKKRILDEFIGATSRQRRRRWLLASPSWTNIWRSVISITASIALASRSRRRLGLNRVGFATPGLDLDPTRRFAQRISEWSTPDWKTLRKRLSPTERHFAAAPDDFHASILTCELAQTDRHDIGFLKLVSFGRFAPEQAHWAQFQRHDLTRKRSRPRINIARKYSYVPSLPCAVCLFIAIWIILLPVDPKFAPVNPFLRWRLINRRGQHVRRSRCWSWIRFSTQESRLELRFKAGRGQSDSVSFIYLSLYLLQQRLCRFFKAWNLMFFFSTKHYFKIPSAQWEKQHPRASNKRFIHRFLSFFLSLAKERFDPAAINKNRENRVSPKAWWRAITDFRGNDIIR